ncbi:MAG TPA: DUF983 domain-containing protein [Acetobacteraceae bacterium]|nr:DUF983 domain-containing protein [Acetobacteraceae bacterium]
MADPITIRWQPDRSLAAPSWPLPPMGLALWRGARNQCPACGQTHLFNGYLKVRPVCTFCGAPLGEYRADDAPPYFTILIVGHIVIPLMLLLEQTEHPPIWLHMAIFLPLTLVLTLGLLRPVKGATVGLMLKLGLLKPGENG